MTSDAARLTEIRARYKAIAPAKHALVWDGEGALVVADGTGGEKFEIARILAVASSDEREFLGEAAGAVGFLLGLVDRAARKVRELAPPPDPFAARSLTEAEMRDQAGRCGCRGVDDMCPCQNAPDRTTRARWEAEAVEQKNFAAEAAIKCGEAAFKRFLMERHGLDSPATDERAAQKLRSLLGVTSRRELNSDAKAAARWKAVRGEFENWKRAGP